MSNDLKGELASLKIDRDRKAVSPWRWPVSKLLHAPGVFFSPSRNQADDPREARHLAPWAARLDRK